MLVTELYILNNVSHDKFYITQYQTVTWEHITDVRAKASIQQMPRIEERKKSTRLGQRGRGHQKPSDFPETRQGAR